MRVWTIVFSLIFALAYHLDAVKIYSQLSTDPALRDSLTKASGELMKKYGEVIISTSPTPSSAIQSDSAPASAQNNSMQEKNLADATEHLATTYKEVRNKLSEPGLAIFEVPAWDKWWDFGGLGGLFRILATAALLSLGAPFWYNSLKGLVNLRSQVAEQQQKEANQ